MASEVAQVRLETSGAWEQAAEMAFRFLFVLVFVLALGWLVSNCREVPADSRAIVLRFGTVVREASAGLLLAWPRPFEQVIILPSADRQIAFNVGAFQPDTSAEGSFPPNEGAATYMSSNPRRNAGMLLTGDTSVVHFNARLFYQITAAKAYVLSADHVAPALERLFVASAVAVTARRDLDTILVARPDRNTSSEAARAGRERLRGDLLAEVNRRLEDLADQGASLGITVSRVDLVPSIPGEAKSAFDSVLFALQNAQTVVAQARTSAETATQKANQDRDRILTNAQAMAQERTTLARSRTASIMALSQEAPGLSSTMLSSQLYQEQVGPLFGHAGRVFTTDGAGGARLILPGSVTP